MPTGIRLFEATFEHAPIGMALVGLDDRFLRVNRALCDLLGYTEAQLLRATVGDLTHPDDRHVSAPQLLTHRGDPHAAEMMRRYVRGDGQVIWAQLNVAVIRDERGQPLHVVAQVQDRTLERDQQQRLQAVQDQLQLALDGSQATLWDWWAQERRIQFSAGWLERFGYAPQDVGTLQDDWVALIHPADLPELLQAYQTHADAQTPFYEAEYRLRAASGDWRWIQLRGRISERGPAGEPTRITGTQLDITARVQASEDLHRVRADLQAILDHMPATIGYWDRQERNRFSNAAYLTFFGRTPDEVRQLTLRELLGDDLYRQNHAHIQGALLGQSAVFERSVHTPSGERYLQAAYVPDIQGGEVRGFFALGTDITARRRAELDLIEAQDAYRVTLDGITDSVLRLDADGRVCFQNARARHLFGKADGQPLRDALGGPDGSAADLVAQAQRTGAAQHLPPEHAAVLDTAAGPREVAMTASPLTGKDGENRGAVLVVRDVTEQRALNRRMTHLAQHDALTDLPNRVLLHDRVTQATAAHQRRRTCFALMFLDLDHFKDINDTLGHHVGDALLRQVAARLRSQLRAADTVSRLGGDEFVLLLTDLNAPRDAQHLAGKILGVMQEPFDVHGHRLNVTGSAGLALYPDDGAGVEDLMRHADAAMYRAKRDGRNRFHFFSGEIRAGLLARQQLMSDLRAALDGQQFRLHYQPKVDLDQGRVTGVEALLRWPQPDGTFRPPLDFIPLAEETGLIVPIGAWALREACRQTREWTAAGLGPLSVAVNVSPAQFSAPDFTAQVQQALRDTGLPPQQLELELTEGLLLHDIPLAQGVLTTLRELGVQTSIDDFGTGFASLSYLKRLPVSGLKIDQSFVQDLGAADTAIVQAILTISGALNLSVIAEGVETAAQAQHLLKLRCSRMQGYLFARPLPPADLPAWHRAWRAPAWAAESSPAR
ncbi:sensor domain-containing protein [Deinococcus sedimenti]|uniref:EAL domain-containing protein n=1 Tax=Deinococcus sedimenti TaxID=1867090 RepID=A0ABQ2S3Y5_9DEIO|nr:EAL domain-containing protein [Deinococcus sedimenti]GGR92364.1 hypothetical protein GCM10008960_19030 [Deinococcus sedimenti]